MRLPPAWADRMRRAALTLLAAGLLAIAASETVWSASLVPAALAGTPRAPSVTPAALASVLDVGKSLAPAGIFLLAALALTRNVPAAHRRGTLVALALVAFGILVPILPGSLGPRVGLRSWLPATLTLAAMGAGVAAAGWSTGRRAVLATGAALLALRYPALALAQDAYVRASGDFGLMRGALAWSLVPGLLAASGLALLAMGLLVPRSASGKAYPAKGAMGLP